MGELGFFLEDEQVELIRGEIVQMPTKQTPHSVCNTRLIRRLILLLGECAIVRGQEPIILPSDSEPQPDGIIARNCSDDYLSSHPFPAAILLVIEISDSTLSYDQKTKLSVYAEAGICDYWLFNLVENYLEFYSEPYQDRQGKFSYRSKRVILSNERATLPCFPDLSLNLDEIFP